jgi:hypothetical protein
MRAWLVRLFFMSLPFSPEVPFPLSADVEPLGWMRDGLSQLPSTPTSVDAYEFLAEFP